MTNRERIQNVVADHIKLVGTSTSIPEVTWASQITTAGLLMVIADILDDMNEREKSEKRMRTLPILGEDDAP